MPKFQPALVAAPLAWIGRQGTRALAASIFIGLAVPPLAALLKPIFTETLFAMLCLAFLRVDPAAVRHHAGRRALIVGATLWMMVAVPVINALALAALPYLGADLPPPAVALALTLQTVAPPIIGSPAVAALMGLDGALSLVTMVAGTAIAPLTAPALAYLLTGATTSLSPVSLGVRLFTMLAGAALVAAVIRRAVGQPVLDRYRDHVDGLNVMAMFVFAVAFMDGVPAQAIADPIAVAGLLALAVAITVALGAVTALVFARAGRSAAVTLAVTAACRNMGLMLAAAGAAVPAAGWFYMALAQFPIYLLPHLLKRVARRWAGVRP
jgi:BASS family bile acid:Na+ symporter